YTLEAEVAKVDPGRPTSYLKVSLKNLTNGTNGHQDVLLTEDDQVFIRQIPEWEVGLTVEVRGEVMFPGTYAIVKDETHLSEILAKTGGFTEEAFLQEATVTRPANRNVVDKEHERLKEMRRDEMTDLEYQYLVMRQNTANVEHVVVDFEKLVNEKDHTQDIILEDGDIIDVPKAPKVVMVTGRVAHAGGVTYTAGANLKYYLSRAGGASWDADLKKTKVIKNTGEVLDDEDVNNFRPGDTIWVPRKPDKNIWPVVVQTISVAAQLASIYLIIDTAKNR
ncbi:SLBB domain-containing protein, partial [bacterium]|nr:SLBB domain-containing protein [bacterium]